MIASVAGRLVPSATGPSVASGLVAYPAVPAGSRVRRHVVGVCFGVSVVDVPAGAAQAGFAGELASVDQTTGMVSYALGAEPVSPTDYAGPMAAGTEPFGVGGDGLWCTVGRIHGTSTADAYRDDLLGGSSYWPSRPVAEGVIAVVPGVVVPFRGLLEPGENLVVAFLLSGAMPANAIEARAVFLLE